VGDLRRKSDALSEPCHSVGLWCSHLCLGQSRPSLSARSWLPSGRATRHVRISSPRKPTDSSSLSEAERVMLGVLFAEGAPWPRSVWSWLYPRVRSSGSGAARRSVSAECCDAKGKPLRSDGTTSPTNSVPTAGHAPSPTVYVGCITAASDDAGSQQSRLSVSCSKRAANVQQETSKTVHQRPSLSPQKGPPSCENTRNRMLRYMRQNGLLIRRFRVRFPGGPLLFQQVR
jgi:hypothetical protein